MRGRRRETAWLIVVALAGCAEARPEPPVKPTELGRDFDQKKCGTIDGRVVWQGNTPDVPPIDFRPYPFERSEYPRRARTWSNPHVPSVNPENQGIGQAVVFLHEVNPVKSKPWDHEVVTVEIEDWTFTVHQGKAAGKVGFVRRGTSFTVVNKQDKLHFVQGSDQAYLSIPLVGQGQSRRVRLDRPGQVELRSGAGYSWMRAHLFACEHPYYRLSGADGEFRLEGVPEGTYEVACWLPNWRIVGKDRHPESAQIQRLQFAAPVKKKATATVRPGDKTDIRFMWREEDFMTPDGTSDL